MKILYSILLNTTLFAGFINGMEIDQPRYYKNNPIQEFCELDDTIVTHYVGRHPRYYHEYHCQRNGSSVTFPLDCVDPLELHCFNDIYYFFTSAVEGKLRQDGQAIQVIDQTIDDIFAIRCKMDHGNWAQVYCGIDPNNYKQIGEKRFYQCHILAIQYKNTRHIENKGLAILDGAKNLDNHTITTSLTELTYESSNPGKTLQRTLLAGISQNGIEHNHGHLLSKICYWTKEENKLKGFKYNSKN